MKSSKTQSLVVAIINLMPGWAFIVLPLVILLFLVVLPVPVQAQVTMQVPFQAIGTDGYIPILPTSSSSTGAVTQVLLRGTDENGNTVYSTPWVEVEPEEFADGAREALGDPGVGPSLEALLASSGLDVDRQASDPDDRAQQPPTDWPDAFTGVGKCEHYYGYGVLGNNVSLGQCWNLAQDFNITEWNNGNFYYAPGSCMGGFVTNQWGMRDITAVVRFSWTPNAGVICVPNEGLPAKTDVTEAIPASDEMFRELLMASAPVSPALPEPPPRPVNKYEFTTIINNHTNVFTSITTAAAGATSDYEASGDLADVGGTKTRPSGSNGVGEGVGDLESFCIRNPDKLFCQEGVIDGGGGDGISAFCIDNPNAGACTEVDPSVFDEFEEPLSDLTVQEGLVIDEVDRLVDQADDYEFGDGPSVGPAAGACPFTDVEFSFGGVINTMETDTICDGLGGPIRQVIEIAGMLIAAFIIIKGLS